ncbi:MAG: CDGSH iron-sulfur domain-containing protein [Desulfurococcales archaeon]|nr:CDGSH iron-sulfur domain-containing protein [Desulfurococcales archaeon]
MARLILFRDRGPRVDEETLKSICWCGLSKTYPYCSGMHIHITDEDEEKIYVYDSKGNRIGAVAKIILEDGREIDPAAIYMQRRNPRVPQG